MGFIVASGGQVRLLPAQRYEPVDRIIELVPQVMCELKNALAGCGKKKQPKEQPQQQPQPPEQQPEQ